MLHEVLTRVLRPLDPPLAFASAREWWDDHLAATSYFDRPIDRAIAGAARVDRLGFAFAGGYAAALRSLVPMLPEGVIASLAATEKGNAHPRAIETTLSRADDGWTLTGQKDWVTLARDEPSGVLLVVARVEGAATERPSLRVARVDADAPGVAVTPLPEMPLVPEIPHASVRFEGVRIGNDDLLPGDGYDRYLKPFRTVEDVHVHAAGLAFLLATGARARWPHPLRARMLAALVAFRALADADASAPEPHVALGGAIAEARSLVEESAPCWALVDEPTRARWERDRAIFDVAGKARAQRLASAWARLEGEPPR